MTERQKALSKLTDWMPNAVSSYQTVRNYDLSNKQTTSRISHHMSSGLISEMDVINCANGYSIPFKKIINLSKKFFGEFIFVAILKRIHLFGLRIKESSKYT